MIIRRCCKWSSKSIPEKLLCVLRRIFPYTSFPLFEKCWEVLLLLLIFESFGFVCIKSHDLNLLYFHLCSSRELSMCIWKERCFYAMKYFTCLALVHPLVSKQRAVLAALVLLIKIIRAFYVSLSFWWLIWGFYRRIAVDFNPGSRGQIRVLLLFICLLSCL